MEKRQLSLILLVLYYFANNTYAQTCQLNKKIYVNLINLRNNTEHCDNLEIVRYCLQYEKSKQQDFTLSRYLEKHNFTLEIPSERNTSRFERFSALYYIHHKYICVDTAKKKLIRLRHGKDYIYESYLNKGYSSESQRNEFIHYDMEAIKPDDPIIVLYYGIIKKYIRNYKRHGEAKAKERYLEAMKKNELEWQYDY